MSMFIQCMSMDWYWQFVKDYLLNFDVLLTFYYFYSHSWRTFKRIFHVKDAKCYQYCNFGTYNNVSFYYPKNTKKYLKLTEVTREVSILLTTLLIVNDCFQIEEQNQNCFDGLSHLCPLLLAWQLLFCVQF